MKVVTPSEVVVAHKISHRKAIEEYVARVNDRLRARSAFPAGHWDVAAIVPMEYRAEVAAQFEAAGWRCSYSTDNTDYADYFSIRPS